MLLFANSAILIFSAGAGYFLAGSILRPIEVMIKEQNRFVADASHELRTPISSMKVSAEVALRDHIDYLITLQYNNKQHCGISVLRNIYIIGYMNEKRRMIKVGTTVKSKKYYYHSFRGIGASWFKTG
jgi:signal transduction histidine kinase